MIVLRILKLMNSQNKYEKPNSLKITNKIAQDVHTPLIWPQFPLIAQYALLVQFL